MWSLSLLAATGWLLSIVSAQTAAPSNSSFPDPQLELRVKSRSDGNADTGMENVLDLLPLWAVNSTNMTNVTDIGSVNLAGKLVITTPSNFNSLNRSEFALISCDPEDYVNQNIPMSQIIDDATSKIRAPNSETLNTSTGGGIILYSTRSQWCDFNDTDGYDYQNVFTITMSPDASALLDLVQSNDGPLPAAIKTNQESNNGNGTSSGGDDDNDEAPALGPAPTTTIAMVILYVITGIITLMFIVIITSGAIRAHRHPERYNRRTLMGRPVQGSRARGIAAGILDTLPIVKFGEREPPKEPTTHSNGNRTDDVELQDTTTPRANVVPSVPSDEAHGENRDSGNTENTPATPDATTTPAAAPVTDMSTEASAEAGLACSVCTDDFVKGQDTRVLPCNHKFHPECIDPWLLNVSGTCPLCRVDLNPPSADPSSPTAASAREATSATSNANPDSQNGEPTTGRDPSPSSSQAGTTRDRRTAGLSVVIHRALNRAHMSSATPEQRLQALRDLRNENRRDNADTVETDATQPERRRDRIRRAVGLERSTGPGS